MQNITDKQWQTHGCLVYQITADAGVAVRTALNVGDEQHHKTNLSFENDDLVSVDLIRPSRVDGSTNGPFLRLSDNSGWIFENKYGAVMAKRLPVDKGLWTFLWILQPTYWLIHIHTFPSLLILLQLICLCSCYTSIGGLYRRQPRLRLIV